MSEYVDNKVVMETFPDHYNIKVKETEVCDELGLPFVEKPTVTELYGVYLDKGNSFHKSLQEQFDRKGYLTDRQLNCVR